MKLSPIFALCTALLVGCHLSTVRGALSTGETVNCISGQTTASTDFCNGFRGAGEGTDSIGLITKGSALKPAKYTDYDAKAKTAYEAAATKLSGESDTCKDYAKHLVCIAALRPCVLRSGIVYKSNVCQSNCNDLSKYCNTVTATDLDVPCTGGLFTTSTGGTTLCPLSSYTAPSGSSTATATPAASTPTPTAATPTPAAATPTPAAASPASTSASASPTKSPTPPPQYNTASSHVVGIFTIVFTLVVALVL